MNVHACMRFIIPTSEEIKRSQFYYDLRNPTTAPVKTPAIVTTITSVLISSPYTGGKAWGVPDGRAFISVNSGSRVMHAIA